MPIPVQLDLGDTTVDVLQKDIKNVHLSVYPPTGRVRISAPEHMKLDTIRVYAISKLDWIKKQQKKIREQERETQREILERESHYVWGKRYLLTITEAKQRPLVALSHKRMEMRVRPGTTQTKRQAILDEWYRAQLKQAIPPLIAKWEPRLGVTVAKFFVQRMKTKWGSCNHHARRIRLNTDLGKKPIECLEYIVVHEMIHLLEPTHNARFMDLMSRFVPNWRVHRETLNRLPVRHVDWAY
jgi:predicted metal-dependent hydrolase